MKKYLLSILTVLVLAPQAAIAEQDIVHLGDNIYLNLDQSYRTSKGEGVVTLIDKSEAPDVFVFNVHLNCNQNRYALVGGSKNGQAVTFELKDIEVKSFQENSSYQTLCQLFNR
jgi:hypothetical protein